MAFLVTKGDRGPLFVAQTALVIVVSGILANLTFNAIATALGAGYPYSNFLFLPDDRFADFFKLSFSYPGQPVHPVADHWGVSGLLEHAWADVTKYAGTRLNHFHVPPLPTLLGLTWRSLMHWIDPVVVFLALLTAALVALFAAVERQSPPGPAAPALASAALLSYPTLSAIDRGHFFSLICAILTISATLRTIRDHRADVWSIMMFAVAVNIRPNVGVVPLVLWLGRLGLSFRAAVVLGIASVGLFGSLLAVVHGLYPAYTFESFLVGLRDYGKLYAGGELGYPTGTSIYGTLRALFGYHKWHFAPPLFIAGLLAAVAIIESRQGRLRASECVFLTLCAYALGTQIFANYHLLVFIIPLVLLAREGGIFDRSDWAVFLGSAVMLIPKNYLFAANGETLWSWQVVANPLILLIASAIVIATAFRRSSPREGSRGISPQAAG